MLPHPGLDLASPHPDFLAPPGVSGLGGLRVGPRNSAMKIVVLTFAALISLLLPVLAAEQATGRAIADAARRQIGKTIRYDPSYRALTFPGGDVPIEAGVCTDVVIRALRVSFRMDLQELVHEDMKRAFAEYPNNWGLKRPDKNIDHRRVPNLQTFFKRRGWALPISQDGQAYAAGDLVTCVVPPNLPHIMIVSDRTNKAGQPLVIHNIGSGTREEDRLLEFKITGHYRIGDPRQRNSTRR
jgi:uncharacterized protein